ncbi:hypothetical protein B2G71_01780 [Novosphingobium sp. PC22D]|uniref:hypothetical protein n=1 Tax=Novosphingobium sp. PC22D TaxID=1962403 RepID=UPI000BF097CD|nr:hypothetical protein [Novosphingobium sp. PC22D]PEQ14353.1 hypothetical protein B2G71_01780 [Novosphingobium sp. PC22D]
MAFIDFRPVESAETTMSPEIAAILPGIGAQSPAEPISAYEWRIVELARGDDLASLRPQRKRGRLARLLFGPQPPSPVLANERLEALRRLAVRAWHEGYRLPASAIKDAIAAGFSEHQAGNVIDRIVDLRIAGRGVTA